MTQTVSPSVWDRTRQSKSEGTECEQFETCQSERAVKTLYPRVPVHIGKIISVHIILNAHRLRWMQCLLKDEQYTISKPTYEYTITGRRNLVQSRKRWPDNVDKDGTRLEWPVPLHCC